MTTNPEDYLAQAPEPQRTTLVQLREALRDLLPEASEELAYGVPAFKVEGRPVAGFAYFKSHCSYFPHSGDILAGMGDELAGYEWSKGTLKFAVDSPPPRDLIERLVTRRLEELALA